MGGLLLWWCDKVVSGYTATHEYNMELFDDPTCSVVTARISSSWNENQVPSFEPGQFFFVNVPEISPLEWHPFTAGYSSLQALSDFRADCGKIVLHIQYKTSPTCLQLPLANPLPIRHPWTLLLKELAGEHAPKYEAASVATSKNAHPVRLLGPFGHFHVGDGYPKIFMFAGGLGITPLMAIFQHLLVHSSLSAMGLSLESIVLSWSVRHPSTLALYQHVFQHIMTNPSAMFKVEVYITKASSFPAGDASSPVPDQVHEANGVPTYARPFVRYGRCNPSETLAASGADAQSLVLVCATEALLQSVSDAAAQVGASFRSEQFYF